MTEQSCSQAAQHAFLPADEPSAKGSVDVGGPESPPVSDRAPVNCYTSSRSAARPHCLLVYLPLGITYSYARQFGCFCACALSHTHKCMDVPAGQRQAAQAA
jgi:hypothetical protein